LLLVFSRLQKRMGFELVAGHVNHRLRGEESEEDEQCALRAASVLGVEFDRLDLTTDLRGAGNLEARARELRYQALHHLAKRNGCRRIATGHTRDDQAETLLLRLVRGTGPTGLSGIQISRADGVIRPLLHCPRPTLRAAVLAEGLPWREDESNRDRHFYRVQVREVVLPLLRQLNPEVVGALAHTASLCGAEGEIVAAWARQQVNRVVRSDGLLDLTLLAGVPATLHGHVIREWLLKSGAASQALARRNVDDVLRLAAGRRASGSVRLGGNVLVARRYGFLDVAMSSQPSSTSLAGRPESRILRLGSEVRFPGGWTIIAGPVVARSDSAGLPVDSWSACCDGAAIDAPLIVRSANRGDRIRPLGLGGTKKLSDVFTDKKVPSHERWIHPVVACGSDIVWVPGIVRGEPLKLRTSTTTVCWLRAVRGAS
jgi:tRNA(Ile)-lysidine synthase